MMVKFASNTDPEFLYNKLYEQQCINEKQPYEMIKNEKHGLLGKLPLTNLRLLENFKKNQEEKRKRVPKIISLFLAKQANEPKIYLE